jgi:hypothetical protein
MLDAALKYLVELASKSKAPAPIDTGDPHQAAFVIDGKISTYEKAWPDRDHKVKSLDEIARLATRFDAADTNGHGGGSPVVWYDETQITLVMDDWAFRGNKAVLALETSDVFAKLIELRRNTRPYEQKDFIRLLRVDLAGTLEPVVLLNKVRSLKFSTTSDATAVKKAQSESLGKEIRSKVETDGGDLPEEVVLMAPVFKTFGLRKPIPVRCAVEVFPSEGTFKLVPMPDEIERAQQEAVQRVAERLAEELPETVPAYFGKP